MLSKNPTTSCDLYLRLEPYLGIVCVILSPLADVDTGAVFVPSVIAMKLEDQRPRNQHLWTHDNSIIA